MRRREATTKREAVLQSGGSIVLGTILALLWQLLGGSNSTVLGPQLPSFAEKVIQAPSDAGHEAEKSDPTENAPVKLAAKKEEARTVAAATDNLTLYLTVPKLGLYDHKVRNIRSEHALDLGAIKLPQTAFPWQKGPTNTYIICHRLGWPSTQSYHQCLNLPSMRRGDEVYLKDAKGRVYKYTVSEILTVTPYDTWVIKPVADREIVSLQTCIETLNDFYTLGPNWKARLIVRADRIR